jgi:GT2 family glycosyltransferase
MVSIMENTGADICCIIPTFSAKNELLRCVAALQAQRRLLPFTIIVVDNGADIETKNIIDSIRSQVVVVQSPTNRGFAGGVNLGIRHALKEGFGFIALLNDDAVAEHGWLRHLHGVLQTHKDVVIVTSKMLDQNARKIDSTGECYTTWGLPYPRGQGEINTSQYDADTAIFGASGGASMYRAELFAGVGLFDEDFFAYYEDVDLSFRSQLAGWKIRYVPEAIVHHRGGGTSSKIPGLVAYHTFKNLPLLLWKNVPLRLLPTVVPRFALCHAAIFGRALSQGRGLWVLKGFVVALLLMPKKSLQRYQIQKTASVDASYIQSLLVHDLPPGATRLRRVRNWFSRAASERHAS